MIRCHSLFSVAGFVVTFSAAATIAGAADARIVKKVGAGSAFFTVEGGTPQAITGSGNETVPEHAQITTGAGVEVYVETFAGAVATVRENSVVTLQEISLGAKRKARLNLKSGEIVSTVDPSRKSETDYGIVTPTGVAAARGTVFAVRVVGNTNSVGTLSGIVEIDRGPGLAPLRVPFGQMALNSAAAQSLAALAQSDPSVAADIVSAVQVVANNVGGSLSGAGNAENATGELAAVTSAAVAAVPAQSATIVSTAIRGATEQGATTSSGGQTTTSNALAAITDAAVRAAVGTNNPQQISAITEAATSTVASAGRTTSANDNAVSAAVSAITSAAVGAAPTQAAAAAQGAAKGVIEAKVADAVANAKNANPNASADELAAAANAAANSAGATAAVSTIATTATGRELAATGQANTATANTVGTTIAAAVNAGSAAGASSAGNQISSSATVTAPTVTVTINPGANGLVINSTSGTADTHSTATQTVNGNNLTPITTQTVSPTGTTQTVIPTENILPPLDQTQPVVSPSRPQ